MAIYIYAGKILFISGDVATSQSCCCASVTIYEYEEVEYQTVSQVNYEYEEVEYQTVSQVNYEYEEVEYQTG